MAEIPNLSEHFRRAQTRTLLCSAVLFFVANLSSTELAKLNLLDMNVGQFNKPFLVIVTFVVSLLSLSALLLAYRNEGETYLRSKLAQIEEMRAPREMGEELRAIRNQMAGASAQLVEFIESAPELPRIAPADAEAMIEAMRVHVQSGRAGLSIDEFAARLGQLLGMQSVEVSLKFLENHLFFKAVTAYRDDELTEMVNIVANEHQRFFLGANRITDQLSTSQKALSNFDLPLSRIQQEMKLHRRAMNLSTISHVLEVRVLNIYVPLAAFGIAALHALGALGPRWLPSLPEVVARPTILAHMFF